MDDLEPIASESAVGEFRLDILARDSSGRAVAIENQFGPTNHKHLGQLLTYTAGVGEEGIGAKTAVGIAEAFCEEHRRALDRLNEVSGTRTGFFGVVLEAWQIDDSKPAVKFLVVSKPNSWAKQIAEESSVPTQAQSLYREFWTSFKEYALAHSTRLQ